LIERVRSKTKATRGKQEKTQLFTPAKKLEGLGLSLFLISLCLSLLSSLRMGSSASAPRQAADGPSKPLQAAPKIIFETAAALGSAASSSESSDDDSAAAGVATAASPASPSSPIEPPPLDHPTPDALARMCSAVATLIEGVGEDSGREGLFDTPKVSRELLRERGRERDRLDFPVATDTHFLTGVPLSSIL